MRPVSDAATCDVRSHAGEELQGANQSPSISHAGSGTIRMKMMIQTRMSTRALGNRRMYPPMTAATAPEAPTIGMRLALSAATCANAAAAPPDEIEHQERSVAHLVFEDCRRRPKERSNVPGKMQ